MSGYRISPGIPPQPCTCLVIIEPEFFQGIPWTLIKLGGPDGIPVRILRIAACCAEQLGILAWNAYAYAPEVPGRLHQCGRSVANLPLVRPLTTRWRIEYPEDDQSQAQLTGETAPRRRHTLIWLLLTAALIAWPYAWPLLQVAWHALIWLYAHDRIYY